MARRVPRQSRSRVLVGAVLEGALQVLAEVATRDSLRSRAERLADASTKRIATRAGVSVGSIYQYFASKDSLFAALIDRELARQEELFEEVIRGGEHGSTEQLVADVVARAKAVYADTKGLGVLFLNAIRLQRVAEVAATRRRVAATFADELRRRGAYDEPLAPRIELLVHAIMGVFEAHALAPQKEELDLEVELTRLSIAYLDDLAS